MPTRKYSSRSQQTTLTAGINSSVTSATVVSGSALLGGITISAGEIFTVVIDPDTALEEIVDVTAVSTNTLTIVRAIDGSTAQSHSAGAVIRHMAIGRDYREANTHIESVTGHGATGAVVGTTNTQTLTNKTLTSPVITSPTIDGVTFTEAAQDAVGAMFSSNTESGISVVYDDATHKVNFDVNDPVITIAGDVTGSATMTDLGNTTITVAIPAGTIVNADVNASAAIDKTKIAGTAITAVDTGTVTTTIIADSAVTSAKIADLTIATGDIADSAITSAKIADGTIVAGDLADGAVTSAKILDGTIVNADINSAAAIDKTKISGVAVTVADTGTVTSAMLADGTIVNGDINSAAAIAATKIAGTAVTQADTGTVTSTMIADATIVDADVSATAAIAKTKLNLGGTITSADLVDGTIVNADINASAAIALSKLATDPLARANHTGTQTASTISDFDTQVRTNRLDQMAAPTAAVAFNAQKITGLADPTSAQDAVTLNYITTQKGAVNGIAELDGNGLVPTHHLPALAITTTQVVNSQSAMLALTAQIGDVAVRTDLNKSFILTATPATTLANWQELLTPTDAVLSVDGSTGAVSLSGTYLNKTTGMLAGNLDADGFKITFLGTPTDGADAATKSYVDTVAGSATAAAASAAAAATSYDNFDDRYLGSKSTAPTLDNDGNTLLVGAIYWNSSTNAMYAWTGTEWGSISSTADIYRFRFTASGGETSISGTDDNGLTLAYIPAKEQIYLNGVLLARTSDYNATNGSSITGLSALTAGDILEVITFTAFELVDSIARSVFDAKGDLLVATGADTPGKLTAGSNGLYLKTNSATATGLEWAVVDTSAIDNNYILALMGAI